MIDTQEVFKQIGADDEYKNSINLYDTVKRNNNFYHDKQWEGVNAPNLDKPVFNILKPAVKYYIGQLVSDDIGVKIDLDADESVSRALEDALQKKVDMVFENVKFGHKSRTFLRNSAVDGDGCMYWFWDDSKSRIDCQLINNTEVVFGDASIPSVEEQPYIIVKQRLLTAEAKKKAKAMGCAEWEDITPNTGSTDRYNSDKLNGEYTDIALKFWKADDGNVHWAMCTEDVIIRDETDLRVRKYPIVWMPWEQNKNSYHGVSPITGQINNQIFINKVYAMAMEYQKSFAFPKVLYDKTIIPKWNNNVGQAIAVNGNPSSAMFASFAPAGMNDQAIGLAESTVQKSKDSLGVYDAALGNIKPDNTSAIIAVQKASAQPLEVQKLDYYQSVEDSVRIILEFTRSYDPLQKVTITQQIQTAYGVQEQDVDTIVNLAQLNTDEMSLEVTIGSASYWSELMQIQTLDNLMNKGIIPDPVTYLESIPDGYIKNKAELINAIKDKQLQMQAQQMQMQMQQAVPLT